MEMTDDERKHMEEREKKGAAQREGIELNTNHTPVHTEGKVTGSNA